MKYCSLDKKAITIMRINAIIGLFVFGLIYFLFRLFEIDMSKEVAIAVNLFIGGMFLLLLLNVILFPNIRYQRYKYNVNDEIIDVKKGLIVITRSIVPIERVQKIELTMGPIDRHYGLSTVVIYTAAGTVSIKFLKNEVAQKITDYLNKIIKEKANVNE